MRCTWLLALTLAAGPVAAQTSYPMVTSVYPAGLQRGTTAEIEITGSGNLAGVSRALFEGEGLTAEVVPPEAPKTPPPTPAPPATTVRLKVTAAAGAALGPRQFRVLTPRGASTIGELVIGDEPERSEKEPNDTRDQAEAVVPPLTVNGRIQAAEDMDLYKVHAESGQEIVFTALSARLQDTIHDLSPGGGGVHSDLMLVLSDAEGREIASNDDYYRADPMLAQRFEKTGDYFLTVRDVRYAGHPTWTYRLTITRRPYLTAVYPMAGQRGSKVSVTPVGFNLGGMAKAEVNLPPKQDAGPMDLQLPDEGQTTNPVPFLVTDLHETLEQEPNDRPDQANRVELPGGMDGRIGSPNDVDGFRFHAAKGAAWTFETQARRYGSALDPTLAVTDASGKVLASDDDAPGLGKDARLEWTAPADGDYVVQLTDLHGRGGNTFVYHLTATPTRPDFTLQCDDDRALVGPGSGYAMYVIASRRGGFAGEIQLGVEGLPPGVTATAGRIPPDMIQGCVIFRAAPDAKIDAANIRVFGTAAVTTQAGTETIRRVAEPLEEIYLPGGGRGRYAVHLHTVSVTEPSDVVVKVSANKVQLAPGGTAAIDVEITRQKGYNKPVVLDVYLRHLGAIYGNPLPPGVTLDEAQSKTLLGPTETKGRIVLKASPTAAPVQDLPIAVLGQVSVNFVVKVSHASEPVLLSVVKK